MDSASSSSEASWIPRVRPISRSTRVPLKKGKIDGAWRVARGAWRVACGVWRATARCTAGHTAMHSAAVSSAGSVPDVSANRDAGGADGSQFVRAAANLLVASQHSPAAAADLGDPLDIGRVAREVLSVSDERNEGFTPGRVRAAAPLVAVDEERQRSCRVRRRCGAQTAAPLRWPPWERRSPPPSPRWCRQHENAARPLPCARRHQPRPGD